MELLHTGPAAGIPLVLAHGAGTPMDHPFMETFASLLAERGVHVVRFEFPYMAARRNGTRRPPDREPVARAAWLEVITALGGRERVMVGGKSFGGRMASLVADEAGARGLVCLGYPFHPSGHAERPRTEHLERLRTPALFLQGERDTFGNRDEVERYALSPAIRIVWLPDGDHSFRPRRGSGETLEGNYAAAADGIAEFIAGL